MGYNFVADSMGISSFV